MNLLQSACLVLLLGAAAGCSQQSIGSGDSVMEHVTLKDDRVGANAGNGKTAWIDSTGALEIEGQLVALGPEQRVLTMEYRASAHAIRDQGIEIGESGAKIAGTAVNGVVDGLRNGNSDQIGSKVEAEARAIEAHAKMLCAKIGQLRARQDSLAAAVPAFLPYATVTDKTVADCRA